MKDNTKKSKKEKRILIGALCIAAVVAAGSTFAWFTSQDEVTNRLTASADYGVSITEDFTPPEDWVPGQTINKDVSAVNTGNIAAFVKLELTGAFNLTVETADGETIDEDLNVSYNSESGTATANDHTLDILEENEAKSLQAGGYLAYAPSGVETGAIEQSGGDDDFTPSTTGLYLFRREVKDGESTTYDYAGYYYDATNKAYYGLKTVINDKGEFTVDSLQDAGETLTDVSAVKLRSYESKTIAANDKSISWDYSNVSNYSVVTATYKPSPNDTSKDIKITISLDNIGDGTVADTWQYVDASNAFYYTDDVEPEEVTNKLVDSVTLDKDTKQDAFFAMDFDLTVKLSSVQVTKDKDGKEITDSATQDSFGAAGTASYDESGEITSISWAAN